MNPLLGIKVKVKYHLLPLSTPLKYFDFLSSIYSEQIREEIPPWTKEQ